MGRAKGVVHIHLGQPGQLPAEGRLISLFLGMEAQVFEQQQLTRLQGRSLLSDRRTDAVSRHPNRPSDQLAQPLSSGLQAVGRAGAAFGPSQMGAQDQPGAAFDEIVQGRQGSPDTGVIADPAVVQGDVEIDPHQDAFAVEIEVTHGLFLHTVAPRVSQPKNKTQTCLQLPQVFGSQFAYPFGQQCLVEGDELRHVQD